MAKERNAIGGKRGEHTESFHILHDTIQNLSVKLLAGSYTRLWKGWGERNIVPGYNKLYYLCKGKYTFQIDGRAYEGRPGQLFLLPYGSAQTYYADESAPAEKYWIHCLLPCAGQVLMQKIRLPVCVQAGEEGEAVRQMFEDILRGGSSLHEAVDQKAAVLRLLAFYIRRAGSEGPALIRDERYLAVTEHIERHIGDRITVDELAALLHLNSNYFIRYFRKMTGSSPMEFVMSVRISHARELLQKSSPTAIKEIAERCGFGSVHYFSKAFRKHTGYTPSQYRKTAINSVYTDKENGYEV